VFDKELALRWALGIVLYSMLVGSGPFRSQGRNSNLLYRDIKEKEVTFPPEKELTRESREAVRGFLTKDPESRLGAKGAQSVKEHFFFLDFDWPAMEKGNVAPPFVPELEGEEDTQYFDEIFTKAGFEDSKIKLSKSMKNRCEEGFPGFTFAAK